MPQTRRVVKTAPVEAPVTPRSSRPSARASEVVGGEPIEIFLRLRPLTKEESSDGEEAAIQATSESSVAIKKDGKEQRFGFSHVFGSESTQTAVFERVAKPEVARLFEKGKNSLLVAYGCSGTGKSHTVHGSSTEGGLLHHILTNLFDLITADTDSGRDHVVFLSYIEIYNEKIFNLFGPTATSEDRPALKVKLDKYKKPVIDKLFELPIKDVQSAQEALEKANMARQCGATKMNETSSRSHALLTIKLASMKSGITRRELIADPEKHLHVRKLTIVDMAGNERAKRTQADGARLREASAINSSLMTFRHCIEALKANQVPVGGTRPSATPAIVPFRDSKLTTLLKEYLAGGGGKTSLIVCASPALSDFDETLGNLKFSAIAREVITLPAPVAPVRERQPSATATSTRTPSSQLPTPQSRKALGPTQQQSAEMESRLRYELAEEFSSQLGLLQETLTRRAVEEREVLLSLKEADHIAELSILAQMNQLYQEQVAQVLDAPTQSVTQSAPPSTTQELETEKRRALLLQMALNSKAAEGEALAEQVAQLENRIAQLQGAHSHETASQAIDQEDLTVRLAEAKRLQVQWKGQCDSLEETNQHLNDQLADLRVLLAHQREEIHNMTKETAIAQPSTPTQSSSHGSSTPSRTFSRVRGLLTPNGSSKSSKAAPSARGIPTTLVHNDSSGNVSTWHGNVNPSLTGNGVSVLFENVEQVKRTRASAYLGRAADDEVKHTTQHALPLITIKADILPPSEKVIIC